MSGSNGKEWRGGYPDTMGWYDCMDEDTGQTMRLRYWKCALNGRQEWINIVGDYVRKKKIKWSPQSEPFGDIIPPV